MLWKKLKRQGQIYKRTTPNETAKHNKAQFSRAKNENKKR